MGRNGFSTIELIIVVVLIGIIATIGYPRMRRGYEKAQIRSAKAMIATMAATARGTAIQRGCQATLNLGTDSVWVTSCNTNLVAGTVQVGTGKAMGSYGVRLASTSATVVYDPRGIKTQFQPTTVVVNGPTYRDSVVINELGRVRRQ